MYQNVNAREEYCLGSLSPLFDGVLVVHRCRPRCLSFLILNCHKPYEWQCGQPIVSVHFTFTRGIVKAWWVGGFICVGSLSRSIVSQTRTQELFVENINTHRYHIFFKVGF